MRGCYPGFLPGARRTTALRLPYEGNDREDKVGGNAATPKDPRRGRARLLTRPRRGAPGGGPRSGAVLFVGLDGVAPRLRPLPLEEQGHEEQKREGWEMWVRMDKILCAVLREAHERQLDETMDALEDGPEDFYKSYLD